MGSGPAPDAIQLGNHINTQTASLLPTGYTYPNVFDGYWPGDQASWARTHTRSLDLTGIAWDKPAAGVLISPRHVLFCSHMGRAVNETLVFSDKAGRPVVRKLIRSQAVANIPLPDLTVGLLDEAVPLKVYKVLPPRTDWARILPGASAFVTDAERKLLAVKIESIKPGAIQFTHDGVANKSLVETLSHGDSGHPAFVLVNGDLVLIETHTYGGPGSGPFLGDPLVFAAVNRTMAMLGGGHSLQTVSLSGAGSPGPVDVAAPPAPAAGLPGLAPDVTSPVVVDPNAPAFQISAPEALPRPTPPASSRGDFNVPGPQEQPSITVPDAPPVPPVYRPQLPSSGGGLDR